MPMIVVKTIHIEDGRLIGILDASLLRVGREVIQNYNDNGDAGSAAGSVTLKINLSKHPDYENMFEISYDVTEKYPKVKGRPSLATGESGVLMADQRGTDQTSPQQTSLLDEPTYD